MWATDIPSDVFPRKLFSCCPVTASSKWSWHCVFVGLSTWCLYNFTLNIVIKHSLWTRLYYSKRTALQKSHVHRHRYVWPMPSSPTHRTRLYLWLLCRADHLELIETPKFSEPNLIIMSNIVKLLGQSWIEQPVLCPEIDVVVLQTRAGFRPVPKERRCWIENGCNSNQRVCATTIRAIHKKLVLFVVKPSQDPKMQKFSQITSQIYLVPNSPNAKNLNLGPEVFLQKKNSPFSIHLRLHHDARCWQNHGARLQDRWRQGRRGATGRQGQAMDLEAFQAVGFKFKRNTCLVRFQVRDFTGLVKEIYNFGCCLFQVVFKASQIWLNFGETHVVRVWGNSGQNHGCSRGGRRCRLADALTWAVSELKTNGIQSGLNQTLKTKMKNKQNLHSDLVFTKNIYLQMSTSSIVFSFSKLLKKSILFLGPKLPHLVRPRLCSCRSWRPRLRPRPEPFGRRRTGSCRPPSRRSLRLCRRPQWRTSWWKCLENTNVMEISWNIQKCPINVLKL